MKLFFESTLQSLSVFVLAGFLSLTAVAAEGNISGNISSITISGNPSVDITQAYNNGSGVPFALVDVGIEGGMPSTLILDSAIERAMILGLVSNLVTRQGATLTGEIIEMCGSNRMDPITQVTFN